MRGIVFILLFCIVFEFEFTEENKTKSEPDSLEKLATDIQNEKSLKGKRFNQFHKKLVLLSNKNKSGLLLSLVV